MTLPDGFTLTPGCFDPVASAEHLQGLLVELAWERQDFTIYGRTVPMPRLIAMYGPVGYRYSGVVHPPCALHAAARRDPPARRGGDRTRDSTRCSRTSTATVATRSDGIATATTPHGGQPDIASVSFGATRRFELRERVDGERLALDLESGSLLADVRRRRRALVASPRRRPPVPSAHASTSRSATW